MADGAHPRLKAPLADVETERLLLRRFRSSDLTALTELFAKPEVWRFPYGRGSPGTRRRPSSMRRSPAGTNTAPQSINPPSGRVCQRLGMTLERVVALEPTERRGAVDVDLYWITAREWQAR